MAEKKEASGGRKGLDPNVYAGECAKEALRKKQFGPMWGEICKSHVPNSLEEAIELKKRELAEVEARLGPEKASSLDWASSTRVQDSSVEKPNPEDGYSKNFRILRAGV